MNSAGDEHTCRRFACIAKGIVVAHGAGMQNAEGRMQK